MFILPTGPRVRLPIAQSMEDFFLDIKSSARFFKFGSGSIVSYNEYHTIFDQSLMGDSTAWTFSTTSFTEDRAKNSLRVPFTAVIKESLAPRYLVLAMPLKKSLMQVDR